MYERTPKESHLDTVWYEIDMLAHCFDQLSQGRINTGDPDWNLLIEGFLLHYRDLIRFYSGEHSHDNDLSTADPQIWANRPLTPEELQAIKNPGQHLDEEFFNMISTYLQHCTKERVTEPTRWNVPDMYRRIDTINAAFKKSFPRPTPSGHAGDATFGISEYEALGTATVVRGPRIL